MYDKKNEEMKALITSWGLPKSLLKNKQSIKFKFDDDPLINSSETG